MFTLDQYKEFLNITIDSYIQIKRNTSHELGFAIVVLIIPGFFIFLLSCICAFYGYRIELEKTKNENKKRLVENLKNELKIRNLKQELGQKEYIIDFGFIFRCVLVFLFISFAIDYKTGPVNNTCDFKYTNYID